MTYLLCIVRFQNLVRAIDLDKGCLFLANLDFELEFSYWKTDKLYQYREFSVLKMTIFESMFKSSE